MHWFEGNLKAWSFKQAVRVAGRKRIQSKIIVIAECDDLRRELWPLVPTMTFEATQLQRFSVSVSCCKVTDGNMGAAKALCHHTLRVTTGSNIPIATEALFTGQAQA